MEIFYKKLFINECDERVPFVCGDPVNRFLHELRSIELMFRRRFLKYLFCLDQIIEAKVTGLKRDKWSLEVVPGVFFVHLGTVGSTASYRDYLSALFAMSKIPDLSLLQSPAIQTLCKRVLFPAHRPQPGSPKLP